jgi:hypothetical protein
MGDPELRQLKSELIRVARGLLMPFFKAEQARPPTGFRTGRPGIAAEATVNEHPPAGKSKALSVFKCL